MEDTDASYVDPGSRCVVALGDDISAEIRCCESNMPFVPEWQVVLILWDCKELPPIPERRIYAVIKALLAAKLRIGWQIRKRRLQHDLWLKSMQYEVRSNRLRYRLLRYVISRLPD